MTGSVEGNKYLYGVGPHRVSCRRTMTATTTIKANGIDISYNPETEDTKHARELAAAFDRGHPAIDRITTRGERGAVAWVDPDHGVDRGTNIDAPDGWREDGVYVSATGSVAIRYVRERYLEQWGDL